MPSARSQTLLRASKALAVASGLLLIFIGTTAKADNITVTEPTDYWFEFTEPTLFETRTYQAQTFSDPMLWLYDSEGNLIAANDDWYNLQSHISVELQAGWYRLRAGVCCGDPDAWRDEMVYELSSTAVQVPPPTSTTVIQETTSSTVQVWPTTTFNDSPTTMLSSTTSSSTTTTQPEATTTTSTSPPPPLTTWTVESTTTTVNLSSSSTPTSSQPSPTSSLRPTSTTGSTTSQMTTTLPTMKPVATTAPSGPTENDSIVAPTAPTTTISPPLETAAEAVAVLSQVSSPEEAAAAIEAIADNIDTLTAEQLDEVARVISAAPVEVKREFEEQVNIFGGGLDSYVPADSNVTVAQRRALVAVGAVLAAAPVVLSRKR